MGEFYSIAVTIFNRLTRNENDHLGKNTTSTIISKGISAGQSQKLSWFSENFTKCR
jgi:Fe-S cluster assembly protein SufB